MCFWIFWSYMHNFVQLLFNTVHCSMETYWFKRRKIKGDKACGSDCGYIYYLVSLKNNMKIIFQGCWLFSINSQAVGWNSWDQSALKLSFGRDLIFESDARFFRYYPEIHFDNHFWNPNSRKKIPWHMKISYSKADFHKPLYIWLK